MKLRILTVLILIGLSVGIFTRHTAAQTAAPTMAATPSAAKPVIRATANGATFDGLPGSYCWPEPGKDLCSISDDPQPPAAGDIPAKVGDTLTFTIEPNSAPTALTITLLDDLDKLGQPAQVDITGKNALPIDANLSNGAHRLEVSAAFPGDPKVGDNFVSYVFRVQVSGSSAVAAVPTGVMPGGATQAATVDTALAGTAASTMAGTMAATKAPTSPSRPTVTPIPTQVPTNPPAATVTPVPTQAAATTALTTSTPATNAIAAASATLLPMSDLAPTLTLTVNGKSYQPIAINACLQGDDGSQVCINRPVNANATLVLAAAAADAQINFGGTRPTAETLTLYNSDGTTVINQRSVAPDNLVLYTLPTNPGTYVLSAEIKFAAGKATYFFRVFVSG